MAEKRRRADWMDDEWATVFSILRGVFRNVKLLKDSLAIGLSMLSKLISSVDYSSDQRQAISQQIKANLAISVLDMLHVLFNNNGMSTITVWMLNAAWSSLYVFSGKQNQNPESINIQKISQFRISF